MKKLLVMLALVAVAVAGAVYWVFPPSVGHSDEGFQTVPVERGPLADVVNATGMLQAGDVALVTSKIPGVVTAVQAEVNQTVQKGDVLLKLYKFKADKDLELAEQDLGKAKALEHGARTAVEKWEKLGRLNIGSEKDLEKARTDLDAAKAVVEEAKTKVALAKEYLALTDVQAPISGTIIDKKVFIGQPVGPTATASSADGVKAPGLASGGPLFIIAKDLSKLQVHAQVGEGDVAKIHVGQRATFTVYAYSDSDIPVFKGTVRQIGQMPTNVQGAVFYDVVLDTHNRRDPRTQEWMLRLGMTATVDVIHNEHPETWKMPMAALNFQLDEHYQSDAAKAKIKSWEGRPGADQWQHVWVLKDKKPWPIFVRTGGRNAQGEAGISDGKFKEVLEWDSELQPPPEAKDPHTFPRVIISAPAYQKPGLFDRPTSLKLS